MGYPQTSDGKQIFMTAKFRGDLDPYFAGAGDDPNASPGRGEGQAFIEGWASSPGSADDKTFEFGFNDWIYIAGGDIYWIDGLPGDHVSFSMYCPASTVTPNPGAGNCNIVEGVIVPAAGDGAYDLNEANPLPAYDSNGDRNGYWDWDEPDEGRGTVTANATGTGNVNLIAADYQLVRWVTKIQLIGSGQLVLVPETKSRKVYPHWRFKLDLHNAGQSTVHLAWFLNCARKKTT